MSVAVVFGRDQAELGAKLHQNFGADIYWEARRQHERFSRRKLVQHGDQWSWHKVDRSVDLLKRTSLSSFRADLPSRMRCPKSSRTRTPAPISERNYVVIIHGNVLVPHAALSASAFTWLYRWKDRGRTTCGRRAYNVVSSPNSLVRINKI